MPITILVNGLTAYSPTPFVVTFDGGGIDANSFAPQVDYWTGSTVTSSASVTIGDLDGDGKADLAVASNSGGPVSVFRNTSTTGTIDATSFATQVDYMTGSTGTTPASVSIGDLDGDGKADLAVANHSSATVSVFRNTSTSGTIDATSFATKVDYTTGLGPLSVSLGDLDGDGKADFAVANRSSRTVSVFRNTSTSGTIDATSFATKVDYTTGLGPLSVSLGDLDGDGKADLVVANFGSNTVSLFRNTSTSGTIDLTSFAPKVDHKIVRGPSSVSISDLDGDGKADLAVAGNTVYVLRNTIVIEPLGLEDDLRDMDVSFYPNPAGNQLHIDKGANRELKIQLLDVSGKLIYAESTKEQLKIIDLSSVKTSIFLLRISNGHNEITQRILKNWRNKKGK